MFESIYEQIQSIHAPAYPQSRGYRSSTIERLRAIEHKHLSEAAWDLSYEIAALSLSIFDVSPKVAEWHQGRIDVLKAELQKVEWARAALRLLQVGGVK